MLFKVTSDNVVWKSLFLASFKWKNESYSTLNLTKTLYAMACNK